MLTYFIIPLENIINLQTKLQAAKIANNRLNEIYLVKSEYDELAHQIPEMISPGILEIRDLTYQYGFNSPTLEHLNLSISPGEKVCFVGTSGSGKSTLAKLIVRFFEPTSGDISINGIRILDIDKKTLRKYINYLPQQPYLFNGSILDNLTLGATNVSKTKITEACQTAEILSDILNMPRQFQTELTTDSGILSGGQRQRLALARALLTDSQILILDESTSNLDLLTEQKIINNLLKMNDKTIIFIAHRLAIAEHSDTIFVLDKGKIKEQGSHLELLQKRGIYYQMLNTKIS
ncbi:ATP-binding cassette domain-containing protein [Streptococcus cuniculipharyngis]|uniref:ATP-binding cassette domain-containing protein n=1 Tax=Streptococcus cuniculipharyngis TaxID=1562651 RepID=A0A5C5SC07_9STRE|nr:ATP-binding cassette domain-containing protein [Streptococcus cuniculipharyngis]TWS97142.1 ATP-binding cassette domain-containing protein [Streptococcus cuniculipharyngis]